MARARRLELVEALRRCLRLASEHHADLITIGGDLWEDENVVADTRRSVAHELGKTDIPIALVTGNHDPLLPGGNYERTPWPDNVHLFAQRTPSELRVGDVSIWGASWTGEPLSADFLSTFRTPDDDRPHLLLIHGTSRRTVHFADQCGYCPFDPGAVRSAGFALVLAGHLHSASHTDGVVYPGSPEPLAWGETGRHCCALVEITQGFSATVHLLDVNRRRYESITVDCAEAASSAEVSSHVTQALSGVESRAQEMSVRIRLVGRVGADCVVDGPTLERQHAGRLSDLRVEDRTERGWDLDALARSATADGRFVAALRARIETAGDDRERAVAALALEAGLRAMAGEAQVLNVD